MPNKKTAAGLFMSAFLVVGCGSEGGAGNDANVGSANDGGGNSLTGVSSELNSAWILSYTNNADIDYTDWVIIDNGKLVGTGNGSSAPVNVGTATKAGSSLSLSLTSSSVGNVELILNGVNGSSSLYQGNTEAFTATLTKYGNGRTQDSVTGAWKTNGGYDFSIDASGKFSSTHDNSGCLINGTLTHKENGVYVLNGTASACIDGTFDGSFEGYGVVINSTEILGKKVGVAQLIFSHESISESNISERYQPLSLTLGN